MTVAGAAASQPCIVRGNFSSALVPSVGEYAVLLPSAYEHTSERFPLLIFLHGGGETRESLVMLQPAFAKAWESNVLPSAVIACPTAGRSQYLNHRLGGERWWDVILDEFIPHIRANFNVVQGALGCIILGNSMGGAAALRFAFTFPSLFQGVAALQPAVHPASKLSDLTPRNLFHASGGTSKEVFKNAYGSWPPTDEEDWATKNAATIAVKNATDIASSGLKVYIECGNCDSFLFHEGAEFLHRTLWELNINHEYRSVDGADHYGSSLDFRFPDVLAWVGRQLTHTSEINTDDATKMIEYIRPFREAAVADDPRPGFGRKGALHQSRL